jgi:hypothetical protein
MVPFRIASAGEGDEYMKMNLNLDIKWSRVLGSYLLLIAALQSFVYLKMLVNEGMDYFYFDPRIGILAFSDIMRVLNSSDTILFEWLTAGWLGFLGILFIIGRSPLITYIVSELILSGPSILFFIFVIIMSTNPSDGFSVQELPYPSIVLTFTTFVPLTFILCCARPRPGWLKKELAVEMWKNYLGRRRASPPFK